MLSELEILEEELERELEESRNYDLEVEDTEYQFIDNDMTSHMYGLYELIQNDSIKEVEYVKCMKNQTNNTTREHLKFFNIPNGCDVIDTIYIEVKLDNMDMMKQSIYDFFEAPFTIECGPQILYQSTVGCAYAMQYLAGRSILEKEENNHTIIQIPIYNFDSMVMRIEEEDIKGLPLIRLPYYPIKILIEIELECNIMCRGYVYTNKYRRGIAIDKNYKCISFQCEKNLHGLLKCLVIYFHSYDDITSPSIDSVEILCYDGTMHYINNTIPIEFSGTTIYIVPLSPDFSTLEKIQKKMESPEKILNCGTEIKVNDVIKVNTDTDTSLYNETIYHCKNNICHFSHGMMLLKDI